MDNAARPSLFPIAADYTTCANDSDVKEDETLDWLQNASFAPAAAAPQQGETHEPWEAGQTSARSSPISIDDDSSDGVDVEVKRKKLEVDDRQRRHHGEKKKKKKKHKHKEKDKKKIDIKQEKGKEAVAPIFSDKTFIEDIPGLTPEHAFRLDPKLDKNLWIYDSVSKLHLAKYRLCTNYIMGADGDLRVSNEDGQSKHKHKPHAFRYFAKDNRREIRSPGQFVHPQQSDKDFSGLCESYIPLSDSSSNNQNAPPSSVDPIGIMDHATAQYIEGKGISAIDSSRTDAKDESCFDETLQKVASFNRRLREDPGNVSLWLEFVQFQEKMSGSGGTSRTLASKLGEAQPRSRAMLEKQLAILDKALSANPGSIPLKLAQMQLWEELWEPAKVDKEWEQLLFVHSGDGQLWRRYLVYQQSRLSTFSVSHVTKLYHKAFRTLLALVEGRTQALRIPHDLRREMICLFVQYCSFLQQSGHMERAVASYQALLEFNLACPPALGTLPTADRIAVFECFWDSSVARIGEDGAQGWQQWAESKGEVQGELPAPAQADTEEAEDAIVSRSLPQWQTWLEIESLRDAAHVLPWRPDLSQDQTVEDCEDLDRLVLVDDVSPVLFPLQGEAEAFVILLNFLRMLGLRTDHRLSCHGYDTRELSSLVQLYDVPQAAVLDCGISLDREPKPHPVQVNLIRQLLRQALGLFSGHLKTQLSLLLLQLEKWQVTGSSRACGNSSSGTGKLPKAQAKELRKFAKTLLKEEHNRNNLLVWNAYAELEVELGKREDAVGIVETALSMFSGSGLDLASAGTKTADMDHSIRSLGLCTLHQTHAQLLFNFHPNSDEVYHSGTTLGSASESAVFRAKASLACLATGRKFQPGLSSALSACEMLECPVQFQTAVSQMVDEVAKGSAGPLRQELLLKVVNCAALWQLCSGNLQEAADVYTGVLDRLGGPDTPDKAQPFLNGVRERLHQSQIALITNAMSTSSVSLGMLRTALTKALECFPHSAALLQCLVLVEARSRIAGRLQRHFDQALKTGESPLPTVFAVLAFMLQQHSLSSTPDSASPSELAASLPETGLVHRTRALFERGLQHTVCQHCPLVWRLYLAFEKQYGRKERAKGIYYRALQLCPWAKELYKDGVREFQEEELQELLTLMTEKEIRVQVPLEEIDLLLETPAAAAMETSSPGPPPPAAAGMDAASGGPPAAAAAMDTSS